MNFRINPPLLNSANPWCSTLEQLKELYASPYTGAVTTRTSMLNGFPHNDAIHQFAFFNPATHKASIPNPPSSSKDDSGSLNTLGYSPLSLNDYLNFIKEISDGLPDSSLSPSPPSFKPFIISVTGTVEEVRECYRLITKHARLVRMTLAMEINLSCPNIPNHPPPAYNPEALLSYLSALKEEMWTELGGNTDLSAQILGSVPIGIKTPPYTYQDQFQQLIDALVKSGKDMEPTQLPCPISFITATNTLGSSLLLNSIVEGNVTVQHHVLDSATGTGIGGMAGAPLHPLALGNVHTIKGLLFKYLELSHVQIIGVGGVEDSAGYRRMRAVGAMAVGVGTALGRKGVTVFEEITKDAMK